MNTDQISPERQPNPLAANIDEIHRQQTNSWTMVGVLTALLVLCYGNTLLSTMESWNSPMYNHGYLIPAFGFFLLWYRRKRFVAPSNKECWIAAGILLIATLIRIYASYKVNFTYDRLTLLMCVASVFIFAGGLRALKWAGPPIAFMVFMFPWPRVLTDNIMRPMQTVATIISAYLLQTLGIDAFRDGNRIMLEHVPMNVAEQCSGLRMLTIFIALSIAMAMISEHRPMWERIAIVLSSPPIALIVNVLRISIIGLLTSLEVNSDTIHRIFHDGAGLIMMPMALGFLFLEMSLLSRVFIEDEQSGVNILTPNVGVQPSAK